MTADSLPNWLAKTRKAKLSTWAIGIFAVTLVLPWCAFAWLTLADRANEIVKNERSLAALAAAYGEHAAAILRRGMAVPMENGAADSAAAREGADEMTTFERALNVPDVHFAVRRIDASVNSVFGAAPDTGPDLTPKISDTNGIVAAEVDRPAAGIVTIASMSEEAALREWRNRNGLEALGLFVRTLIAGSVGAILIWQLRERERLQEELAAAREAAEASSRAKSEFLANMSHELRTPLNAIIGFSEIIKVGMHGPLNARYRDYAGDIFESGIHLLGLINDILDLSKLEARQFELCEEGMDVGETIESAMRLVEEQARKGKIELSEDVPEALPLIRADNRRIRQIVINLLSNAVKFTPEGGRVRISAVRKDGGLAITVSDTGIGMAEDQIAKALEPFGQINSMLSRRFEGTGLGLPLAKKLIELHGGTLSIESTVGAGTAVTVELPPERILLRPAPQAVVHAAG